MVVSFEASGSRELDDNVVTKGGVGSKNDRRAGTHFFEPLLTKMVNKVNDDNII